MRRALPHETILFVDSGAHRAFAGHYWESFGPGGVRSATNLGPMGWAIPAAVGGKLARPEAPVAVITGDGCMRMHGMEVATAALPGAGAVCGEQQQRPGQRLPAGPQGQLRCRSDDGVAA